MSDYNPYAPPQADLTGPDYSRPEELELADRGTRFGAAILDGLVMGIPAFLLVWGLYAVCGYSLLAKVPGRIGIVLLLGGVGIGTLVDLAINGYFLQKYGQTVGKRACSIKIVKLDGSLPTLTDSFLKRRVAISLIGLIPVLGKIFSFVDILFIFRKNRRCLHDDLAGTVVVKV